MIPCLWFHADNRGQCGHTVYVKFLKRLQIRLDASAPLVSEPATVSAFRIVMFHVPFACKMITLL